MSTHKSHIQARFNQASGTYESVAFIQRDAAKILTSFLSSNLPFFKPNLILDIGTGVGGVVEFLLEKFPLATFTLNDISFNMLKKAKEKFSHQKNITFHLGDLETSCFPYQDLIISNFALQWADNLDNTLVRFYEYSNVLAFSCLLKGTFYEWERIFIKENLASPIKNYPTLEKLDTFLGAFNSSYYFSKVIEFDICFPNAFSFMTYLKKLGASSSSAYKKGSYKPLHHIITNHKEEIKTRYNVFFGIIKK